MVCVRILSIWGFRNTEPSLICALLTWYMRIKVSLTDQEMHKLVQRHRVNGPLALTIEPYIFKVVCVDHVDHDIDETSSMGLYHNGQIKVVKA